MNKLLAFLLLLFTLTITPLSVKAEETINKVDMVFFWSESCPHCHNAIPFLNKLEEKYPSLTIHRYEISHNRENIEILMKVAEAYKVNIQGVPTFVIGEDKPFSGYGDFMQNDFINKIEACLKDICVNPLEKAGLIGGDPQTDKNITPNIIETTNEDETINIPLFGEFDIAKAPLILTTIIISFVDGFNPCSLWLIMFLLGMVIHTRSRKKILLISLTFLTITATAYGAFMLGLLNVFAYIGYLKWIQVTIASMALLFAAVNIKDYFWFKQGISFTISDKHKPGMFKQMRDIINPNNSIPAMLGGTAVLALGVVLVELPCTAGFPVIWTKLLAQNNVHGMEFVGLFTLYLLIYMADELVIILTAVITLKASRFEEKHGRILKLIGGMVMATLAGFMLFAPDTLNTIQGTLWVFALAALSSIAVIVIHRKILPKFGIKIGSENNLS